MRKGLLWFGCFAGIMLADGVLWAFYPCASWGQVISVCSAGAFVGVCLIGAASK